MEIVTTDHVNVYPPPSTPNYRVENPLAKLMSILESAQPAAERETYLYNKIQYIFPYSHLEMYGPSGDQSNVTNVRYQDNKQDFQKQNIKDFLLTDTRLARGWASVDGWTGPFLLVSYRGGPDSTLSKRAGFAKLGAKIKAYIKVGDRAVSTPIDVPYNPYTDRYELELWGYPGNDLRTKLDTKGVAAFDRGGLIARPDLVQGSIVDFAREGLDNRDMRTVAPGHTMHPILPLTVEVAFADPTLAFWDNNGGLNYHYQFNMVYRGWDNFLKVGVSEAPHGGFGFLHYRNVLSNYFEFANSGELAREVEPWMFDANGQKPPAEKTERSLTLDYMDLHILKPTCGIGLHRHRDNQEIFFLMQGSGVMVMADWYKMDGRERAFEIRTLEAGSFTLLKAGQLHALYNVTDEDISLLMFGGYD